MSGMIRTLFDKPCSFAAAGKKPPPVMPEDHKITQDYKALIQSEADTVLSGISNLHDFYSSQLNLDAIAECPNLKKRYDDLHSASYARREEWARFAADLCWVICVDDYDADCDDDENEKL